MSYLQTFLMTFVELHRNNTSNNEFDLGSGQKLDFGH